VFDEGVGVGQALAGEADLDGTAVVGAAGGEVQEVVVVSPGRWAIAAPSGPLIHRNMPLVALVAEGVVADLVVVARDDHEAGAGGTLLLNTLRISRQWWLPAGMFVPAAWVKRKPRISAYAALPPNVSPAAPLIVTPPMD
jgi:hypothetical protein